MALKIYEGINAVFTIEGPIGKLMFADRKAIIRACLFAGGEWFKAERIPLRFTDWVYRNGYRVSPAWKAEKARVLPSKRASPFIGLTPPGGGDSGSLVARSNNAEKMSVALARGMRVDVSNTSKGGTILIRTPFGHAINPENAAAFTRVAPEEYQMVAQTVAAALRDWMARAVKPAKRARKLSVPGMTDSWKPRGREVNKRDGTLTTRAK